jgi:quercetin dioxygenase-like cupin family protein
MTAGPQTAEYEITVSCPPTGTLPDSVDVCASLHNSPHNPRGSSRKSTYFVDKSGCSQHTNFPGVDIFTAAGKHMLTNLVEFQPGAIVQAFSHPHKQMGMVLEGQARFIVGG